MTGNTLWQNLKFLVDFDKQISIIEQEIELLEKGLNSDKQNIARLQESVANSEQVYKDERKALDCIELAIKDLKEKEKHKGELLDNISNPKEYKALEKEIENITRRIAEQDSLLEKVFNKLEIAKENYEASGVELAPKNEQFQKDITAKETSVNNLIAKIELLATKRADALKMIPADWQQKYERMRISVQDPVVPIASGTCSACYYSVPHQDTIKLKNHGVLLCRNCYRFLYSEDEAVK